MKNIVLVFLFFGLQGIAQDLPEIVYPSPTASALGEYGNTPISLSTGTPNINIPLWEVKGKKLTVPISLSYRASGIKVEEHGSHVGLGWTLNAGGMITRIVKDKDDLLSLSAFRAPIIDRTFFDSNLYRNGYDSAGRTDLVKTLINTNDTEDKRPDMFYYNFLNYSGKFIFDDADNPMVAPDINFKVVKGTTMKITDANGVIYTFGVSERDQYSSALTGWYLTKIESADLSEWINFEYVTETNQMLSNKRDALMINYVSQWSANSIEWYKSHTNIGYRINRITTSFGETITFSSGQDRIDLHNTNNIEASKKPKTISSIEISASGICIKKLELEYEFIESNNPGYVDDWWDDTSFDLSYADTRLYLKTLNEATCADQNIKTHEFSYYGRTSSNKDLLPSKLSYAQDHWGYYNGKTANQSLRPTFSGNIPDFNGANHFRTVNGANRSPSYPHMQYGTLQSITYPTGGETEFVFEQHQNIYSSNLPNTTDPDAGGLRIATINDKIDGNIIKSRDFEYLSGQYADYPTYGETDLVYVTESYDGNSEQLHRFIHPGAFLSNIDEGDNKPYYKIGSGNPIALGTTNGYHLNYSSVIESEPGNGEIRHRFITSGIALGTTTYDDVDVTVDWVRRPIGYPNWQENGSWGTYSYKWPFVARTDFSWKRGLRLGRSHYSEDGSLVKSVSYEYDFIELKGVKRKIRYNTSDELEEYLDYANPSPMYESTMAFTDFEGFCNTGNFCYNIESTIYYQQSKIGLGVSLLNKETSVENGVTTIKDYTYNDENQLATTTFTNSKSETIVSENKYPQDFATSNNVYSEMVDANVLNPVIESETKNGTNTLSVLKNNFYDWGTNLFAPQTVQVSKGTNALDNRIQFHDYYSNGNVKEVSKQEGPHIYYVWGYNEQYPIAKLENFESSQITTTVQNLINAAVTASDNDDSVSDENTLRTALSNLRNTSALASAMVTTYTYDPLVGVTSMTDPRGYTIYYEYDEFNRLEFVKDADDNLVSENKYNYKN